MKLRFSPESVQDLQCLHDFIAKYDPDSARTVVLNLKSAVTRLAEMPRMGKPLEEVKGAREFVFGRYVLRYVIKEEILYLLRVWHSKEQR